MKRFAEQLKKKAETINLRTAERADLRERIVSYMEYHPLVVKNTPSKIERIRSERFVFIHFNTDHARGFLGSFAVFILLIVPVLAERAVPGDVLYPVKVKFNEEVRSTLAVSPYAKVEWETKRLERRIAEARLLASEGKLTDEVGESVAAAVRQHSDAAQESIAVLRQSDSEEAAIAEITFESALTVQSEVLEGALAKELVRDGVGSSTPGASVAALAGVVEATRRDAAEKQSGVLPSYEKLIGKMELETTRAYELFETVKTYANEEEIANIQRRLSDVERKITDARQTHEDRSGDEGVAEEIPTVLPEVTLLRTALSDLQKLISFMTDIDVRENVGIEELVPVTLTTEERSAVLGSLHNELDARLAELTLEVSKIDFSTENQGMKEKIEAAIIEGQKSLTASETAFVENRLEDAEIQAERAKLILIDSENLFKTVKSRILENTTDTIDPAIVDDSQQIDSTENVATGTSQTSDVPSSSETVEVE